MKNAKITLESYRAAAPQGAIDLLYKLAEKLKGKSILHVNSTRFGGGVAEILHRLIPLFNELGIQAQWEVLEGTPLFYKTTKSFHNALQGQNEAITSEMFEEYKIVNEQNVEKMSLDSDVIVIHDPQPAAFILHKTKESKWLWRCHIDISSPQRKVWQFLKKYVSGYDAAIFSLPSFAQKLSLPQFLIYPSIDPLADKNKELNQSQIDEVLNRYNIPKDKPFVLQVSRFDKFKDPLGVIEAYKLAKKYNDCCLVLAGGAATDDPEGVEVLNAVNNAAAHDKDIFVLNLPADSNIEINALQRAAAVVLQKSTKEGFGLTVAEAMWKGKPVIGGAVGGITVQIIYGETGFTVNSIEGCAYRIRYLLNNLKTSQIMGEKAKDFARKNFLITRHLCDYLALMMEIL
ncbi:MAG: glycosyltransferase [Candidatus Omnitrophota bacterium]